MTESLLADSRIEKREPLRPWQHPAFGWTLAVAGRVAALLVAFWEPLSAALYRAEFAIAGLLPEDWIRGATWFALPAVALGSPGSRWPA